MVNDTLFSIEGKVERFQRIISGERARDSILSNAASQNVRPNSSFQVDNTLVPNLEEIKVPKFDGEILSFPNFKGLYENLIHNNPNLTGVQKMQ